MIPPLHPPDDTARLAEIVRGMTEACFAVDADWRFTFVNDRMEKLLGRSRHQMVGHSLWEVFPKVVNTPLGETYRRVMAERVPLTLEAFSPTAERWVEARVFPSGDGLAAFLLDVHERKLLELKSAAQKEELQLILDAVPALVFYKDRESRYVRVNRALAELVGKSPEDFAGKTDVERGVPHAEDYRQDDLRVMTSGEPIRQKEEPLQTPAGLRCLLTDKMPYRDERGEIVGIIGFALDITERKQAEERLRASLKDNVDLRAALDEHAIVAATDAQGRITFVNDKFCSISKYSREELLGQDHRIINSGHHSKEFIQALWTTIRAGHVWHGEIKNRAKDGTFYWVNTTIVPFLDEAGNVRQYVAIRADITARKQVEEALEDNRRFLSDVIERSGSLIFVKSPDGRYQLVNKRWEELTGRSRDEALGQNDEEIFSIEDGKRLRAVDVAVMASGQSQTVEEKVTVDGRVRAFLSVKFPLRDLAGNVTGLCGMAAEITERLEAEQKLREQAALLDNARDAILVRDLEHRVTYWNKSAERLYGWTAQEVMGRSTEDLLYHDPSVFRKACATVLAEGEWVGEIEQVTKDDRSLMVEGHWTLVRDDEGKPKAVLAINTDLTERKKLERQFLRAQRMEGIGTLAGGIAHDLNNVLGPILMSIELLKLSYRDQSSQEMLAIIESSARRGSDMVRQVLSFARGVEGERLEVQVKHLVRDMEKIAYDTFPKNIQVRSIVPHDLWTVPGDPTQLHQVLLNLCVNARDALPNGGKLMISAENLMLDETYATVAAEARPGPYVVLQVEDSGTGMPPEIIDKIFDPFFTTKALGKGTGLGLSTTIAIVKSHGGFIRVYSELDKGTRFRVYLPAQTESSAEERAAVASQLPRGNGELILVVDDEASVRHVTAQTLSAFGYRVIVAVDGAEAVALFARQGEEIALVLTDMMMPVMDGPATIQVLKKMRPNVLIIAASGLAANGHAAKASNLGVKHFLPKPYTADTLLKALRAALTETAKA
jgi:PAS domain S-box-containing protein